jgi:3'-phosphoadenosine 5'-phosphosulfate sulfotransferase (PAPS reductase)/FAD synthetase
MDSPGPFHHRKMYNRLKERALELAMREHKKGWYDKVLLITGVRLEESTRRMGTVQPINKKGSQTWVAPIVHFSSSDKNKYISENNLPRNEVVDLLHMSGECLCGAFAKPNELEWLEFCGFKEEVNRIRELEEKAKEVGVPCKWGHRPPKEEDQNQLSMDMPMCIGCEERDG